MTTPEREEAEREAIVEVVDLRKVFPGRKDERQVAALDRVSFDIKRGEFFTLLGPSGCGKTTTLRCIAGLEIPTSGTITVGNQTMFSSTTRVNVPPHRRGLGMVFQSYAIWPHMDVFQNVALPLRARPWAERSSREETSRRVDRALDKVGLLALRRRRATDLSGGQQQRLALARVLVTESALALFDEPLSNLDAKLRDQMRFELKRLQQDLNITAVYVTHDQTEALAMSNRIAVMNAGRVEQLARPREIYESPASHFVAGFIGVANFLPGTVTSTDRSSGEVRVDTTAGPLLATRHPSADPVPGGQVTISLRPQDIDMTKDGDGSSVTGVGRLAGVVHARAYTGEYVDYVVEVNGVEVRVRSDPRISFAPGTSVVLRPDPNRAIVLPDQ